MNTPVYDIPPAFPQPRGTDKVWTLLSHLSAFMGVPILLPLIVYLAMRHESQYVAENAREALNFHISVIIYSLCCVPLIFLFGLGGVLLGALWLASFIFAIVAAIKASEGGCYRYPMTIRLV